MKLCAKCGVEIDDDLVRCPLCGASLAGDQQVDPAEAGGGEASDGNRPEGFDERRKKARFWLWEMFTIVFVATAIIVAATDFAYGFDLSWAVYPLTSLAFVWVVVTTIIALGKDIPLAYGAITVALLVYLFTLDALLPGTHWFVPFALPITLLVAAVGGGTAGAVRALKLSVFQAMAASLCAIGVFVLGLEVILSFALSLDSVLSWSIVAFGGCLSIALLLWLINKRLRERHADFRRVFHL